MFGSLVDAGCDLLWQTVSFIHVGDVQVTPLLALVHAGPPWAVLDRCHVLA